MDIILLINKELNLSCHVIFYKMSYLETTSKFSVFTLLSDLQMHECTPQNTNIKPFMKSIEECGSCIDQYGFCIVQDDICLEVTKNSVPFFNKFVTMLQNHYDAQEDSFDILIHGISDIEEYGIVRMPRIGDGKHNIHFDIHDAMGEHRVLQDMAQIFYKVMSGVNSNKKYQLRDYGLGVTRPYSKKFGSKGEGIDWHSDGGKGEYTMIFYLGDGTEANMSNADGMEKNENDLGCLKVIPNSHLDFDSETGIGHGTIDCAKCEQRCDKYHYYYQYYTPIIFDARLLHCGSPNSNSKHWRNIVWYIFDSY